MLHAKPNILVNGAVKILELIEIQVDLRWMAGVFWRSGNGLLN